jgi:hypothetical protein
MKKARTINPEKWEYHLDGLAGKPETDGKSNVYNEKGTIDFTNT